MEDKFGIERDILMELNPKLRWNDFEVLNKLDKEFDLLGVTDFNYFILEDDLDAIISRMICDFIPYRVMEDKNFEITEVARYDRKNNKVLASSDNFNGMFYINEQIEKMNKLLENGESKV